MGKEQVRLLSKIKRNYDSLKHKLYYQTDAELVKDFIDQFFKLF